MKLKEWERKFDQEQKAKEDEEKLKDERLRKKDEERKLRRLTQNDNLEDELPYQLNDFDIDHSKKN